MAWSILVDTLCNAWLVAMDRVQKLQSKLDQARDKKQQELDGQARPHVLASYDNDLASYLEEIKTLQSGIQPVSAQQWRKSLLLKTQPAPHRSPGVSAQAAAPVVLVWFPL